MVSVSDVPAELVLVRQFLNTSDLEEGTDELADSARFAAWLEAQGLPAEVTPDDLGLARRLRDALRLVLLGHHDADAARGADELGVAASDLSLKVTADAAGVPTLVAADDGVRGVLETVLAGASAAAARGTWERLKICPADACGWAFYDQSKNRSRRWCSMEVCGNRTKTRAYRQRQR